MKITSRFLGILIFAVIFGSVGITSSLNLWNTTTSKVPGKITEGEFAGQANPDDIRGSYTFRDISENFDIPLEDLGTAFGLLNQGDYGSLKVKDVKDLYNSAVADGKEIGASSVRYFTALYKGLPLTLTEDTYLPVEAVEILRAKADLTPEQIKELEEKSL